MNCKRLLIFITVLIIINITILSTGQAGQAKIEKANLIKSVTIDPPSGSNENNFIYKIIFNEDVKLDVPIKLEGIAKKEGKNVEVFKWDRISLNRNKIFIKSSILCKNLSPEDLFLGDITNILTIGSTTQEFIGPNININIKSKNKFKKDGIQYYSAILRASNSSTSFILNCITDQANNEIQNLTPDKEVPAGDGWTYMEWLLYPEPWRWRILPKT